MQQSLRIAAARVMIVGFVCLLMPGCQKQEATTPVSGMVTIDGVPVEAGTVAFEPEDPTRLSPVAEIRNGQYSIDSPRGKRRISIMAYRQAKGLGPDGQPYEEQFLPMSFNTGSDRFVEVGNTPMTDLDFHLTLTDSKIDQ